MPLKAGKPHVLAKPPKNMKIGESLYVVPITGEMFSNKKDYDECQQQYEEAQWMCKCTGKNNLTYKDAVKSEKESREKLKKLLQPSHVDVILNIVQNNSSTIDQLTETCHSKLSSTLNIGEKVVYSINKDLIPGNIINTHTNKSNSPTAMSDKENSVNHKSLRMIELCPSVSYDLETASGKTITSVNASELKRVSDLPNKDTIRRFISAHFSQYPSLANGKWHVDSDSFLKSHVRNKGIKRKASAEGASKKSKLMKPINHNSPLKDFLTNSNKHSKADPDIIVLCQTNKPKVEAKNKKSTKTSPDLKKKSTKKVKSTNAKKTGAEASKTARKSQSKKTTKNEQTGAGKKKTSMSSDDLKISPKKKMKQMTLFDMSSSSPKPESSTKKSTPKEKEASKKAVNKETPSKNAKTPKSSSSKSTKSSTKKKSTLTSLKKSNSGSKKLQMASKSLKKAMLGSKSPKNKQSLLFTAVKTASTPKSKSNSPALKQAVFAPVDIQELKFKQLMKKIIQVKSSCSRKHYRASLKKGAIIYEPRFSSFVPEAIREDFITKLDLVLSKMDPADVNPKLLEEYQKRVAELEEKKKQANIEKKLTSVQNKVPVVPVDDKLLDLEALPEAKLVSTPDGIPNELFGDVAMITEFLNCYQGLVLSGSTLIYSNELMDALAAGRNSYRLLSKLLVILLQTLLADQVAEDYEELGFKLNEIPVNEFTAGELLRLCLRVDDSIEKDEGIDGEVIHQKNDEVPEELISEIEVTEFYDMDAESKLKIICGLVHRVLSSYSIQRHKNVLHENYSKLYVQRRNENEAKKMKKQLQNESKPAVENEEASKPEDAKTPNDSLNASKEGSPNLDNLNDLASIVKNRRVLAKKAMEEKEIQDELKRKEIEKNNFNIDYQEAYLKWKQSVRFKPIGMDRNFDRYWMLSSTQYHICVEKGWTQFLDYRCEKPIADDESECSFVSSSTEQQIHSNLESSNSEPRPASPTPFESLPMAGQNLWFCYESVQEVDKLLEALGPGIRERNLKTQLKNLRPLMTARRRAMREFVAEDYTAAMTTGLQTELVDFAKEIVRGGMGAFKNLDKWCENVKKSTSIQQLGKCILDLHNSIIPRFFSKIMSTGKKESEAGKSSDSKLVQYWKDAVTNCQTLSRLHVLAAILDACVKWNESAANIRCKVCRQLRSETQTIVCTKCSCGFHLSCLRPVLNSIPEEDWFCSKCLQEKTGQRSSRRNYAELKNSDDEGKADSEDEDYEQSEDGEENSKECLVCGGDEDLISCSRCPASFHGSCHQPPLRNAPRGLWACCECVTGKKIKSVPKASKKSKGNTHQKSKGRKKPEVRRSLRQR